LLHRTYVFSFDPAHSLDTNASVAEVFSAKDMQWIHDTITNRNSLGAGCSKLIEN